MKQDGQMFPYAAAVTVEQSRLLSDGLYPF